MVQRYLLKLYIRHFFLILFALVTFFVGLDFLTSLKKLPNAANLQLLYAFYKSLYGIEVLTPISLVFAVIATALKIIRSNELVALYSLGYSHKFMLKPFIWGSLGITLLYIGLHFTPFTYAEDYAKSIKRYNTFYRATNELFFKYQDSFVFFRKLYPIQKMATDVSIYEMKENRVSLKRLITAPKAIFKEDRWHLQDAKIIIKEPDRIKLYYGNISTLIGYRPKILDSVYEGKTNISLIDAFYAKELLAKEKLDTTRLRAIILYELFYPFFAPLLIIIISYFVPVTTRLGNLNLFTFGSILFSLIFWGMYYSLIKLSFNGAIPAYLAVFAPLIALAIGAWYIYQKYY
ncbi:MAG: YjgP/YjgQ family permease [Epsilonproteobacteria bacterium]|nr:YjgP/YjgQ family permease [Campylobacterota bacterium]